MITVWVQASMSLDGYISDRDGGGFERLFAWCGNGDVEIPTSHPERLTYRVSEASAGYVRQMVYGLGAAVIGRRFFDLTQGWNGRHPLGVPVFVVTHKVPDGWPRPDVPFTFVTEGGVESAIERAGAVVGDKVVGVGPGTIAWQALLAGLVDEVRIDLVPVVFGGGTPYFGEGAPGPMLFDDPEVIAGRGVTHLIYRAKSE